MKDNEALDYGTGKTDKIEITPEMQSRYIAELEKAQEQRDIDNESINNKINKINKIIQQLRKLEYEVEGKRRYTFEGERVDLWVVIDNLVAEMLVLKGVGASQEELDFIKRWEK
jgi:hypothetical protein